MHLLLVVCILWCWIALFQANAHHCCWPCMCAKSVHRKVRSYTQHPFCPSRFQHKQNMFRLLCFAWCVIKCSTLLRQPQMSLACIPQQGACKYLHVVAASLVHHGHGCNNHNITYCYVVVSSQCSMSGVQCKQCSMQVLKSAWWESRPCVTSLQAPSHDFDANITCTIGLPGLHTALMHAYTFVLSSMSHSTHETSSPQLIFSGTRAPAARCTMLLSVYILP